MWKTPEFKVGIFVLLGLGLVAAMSLQVTNDPTIRGKAKTYDAISDNANGLVKNSTVKMAGIPVGIIKDIRLEDGKAHIIVNVQGDIKVTKDAELDIKPNGILGDKYLELLPGDQNKETLENGGRISKVVDSGNLDTVMTQVGKIAGDLSVITNNLKNATNGEGDEGSPIGRILHNVEDVTADLRDIMDNKKDKIDSTIDNIHNITKSINEFVNDESDDGFKTNWKKLAKSLGRVDSILKNVDEVTGKINSGKGTIGKLVNDEQTVEELNHAIAGVNNMLDTANKFQINVDYHSELMGGGSFFKSYVGINIQPGPDRYYIVQVVDDPKGFYDSSSQQQSGGGVPTTTTTTSNVYHDRLKFSAEFAKSFYDLTIRAGIIESTGGAGVDYKMFNKKLTISAEAFAFDRPEGVDVRIYAKYKFYSIFYLIFGGDDILNKGNSFTGTGAAGFVGAGLDFTNDDLKLLLSKAPL